MTIQVAEIRQNFDATDSTKKGLVSTPCDKIRLKMPRRVTPAENRCHLHQPPTGPASLILRRWARGPGLGWWSNGAANPPYCLWLPGGTTPGDFTAFAKQIFCKVCLRLTFAKYAFCKIGLVLAFADPAVWAMPPPPARRPPGHAPPWLLSGRCAGGVGHPVAS